MIQNLENKIELQINSLETRIEKMQEMLNEDIEEIKKSQSTMTNAINEIKNTLEGTKSRIKEAKDRISEVEDTMVEINETGRKEEKRIKRNEETSAEFYQKFREELTCTLLKVFKKITEEGKLPKSFYEAAITLIPKLDKDATQKKKTTGQYH